ncbi:MAG: class I SAM-dependent methyltransferase [Sphingobacteriales bacterium]|nr:class I SAM-dependent methyltransferase [Sphingobacteriales bacterium]
MKLKRILPYKVLQIYTKLKWFYNHFSRIEYNSELRSTHYHGPITYDTDGLTTSNNADFINDHKFQIAYNAAKKTNPWPGFTLQWRIYIVCWFANQIRYLNGDFVECGVNTGAYARAIIDYVNFNELDKTFYLFDTFEGLANHQVTDKEVEAGINFYMGNHYKNVYQEVKTTFQDFNVKIIKGEVPTSLKYFDGEKVAFLSIDMNVVAPEIAAADFFWDKLVIGGVILLDDYGFPMHINQKLAFDEFAKTHNQQILSLPTGQGVIIKR